MNVIFVSNTMRSTKNPDPSESNLPIDDALTLLEKNPLSRPSSPSIFLTKPGRRLALIDLRPPTRRVIARTLEKDEAACARRRSGDFTIHPLSGLDELSGWSDEERSELGMILWNLGPLDPCGKSVRSNILQARKDFSGIPIVLLCDCEEPARIWSALRTGVSGYIPTALGAAVFRQAIQLVKAGGMFIPPNVLANTGAGVPGCTQRATDARPGESGIEFTRRQLEVLKRLREGKSNKLIAYELGMQECTVKAHVHNLMRKLNARNRTEAAMLAAGLPLED